VRESEELTKLPMKLPTRVGTRKGKALGGEEENIKRRSFGWEEGEVRDKVETKFQVRATCDLLPLGAEGRRHQLTRMDRSHGP